MKKILITQSDLSTGGIQKSLINFLNQLDYTKYKVDLVLFEKKGNLLRKIPPEVKVSSISEIFNLNIGKINRKLREFIGGEKYFKKLYNNLKSDKKYDIAIAFDGYVSFTDYYAAFSNSEKKFIWVHSDFYVRKKYQFKFKLLIPKIKSKYKYFDKIITVSKSAQEGFLKIFPVFSKKTIYIWNFMDEIIPEKIEERPDIIFDKNEFNIVSIGALLPVKGYKRLIKVQYKLRKNGFNTKIYIIGEGPEQKKLNREIKKHNLEKHFILLGRKENVFPILKQADLFVSSSYYEGFGVVLLESLASGVHILVPDISGAKDIANYIAPKNSSLVVKNNIEGLYEGIVNYISSEKKNFIFDINKYNNEVKRKIDIEILN